MCQNLWSSVGDCDVRFDVVLGRGAWRPFRMRVRAWRGVFLGNGAKVVGRISISTVGLLPFLLRKDFVCWLLSRPKESGEKGGIFIEMNQIPIKKV